jgi:hypothetical protein
MNARGSGSVFLGIVIIAIAVFYFGFYDTAAQRCSRGDLSACVVHEAQQPVYVPAPQPAVIATPTPPPAGVDCILGVDNHRVAVQVWGADTNGCAVMRTLIPRPYGSEWSALGGHVDPSSIVNCQGVTPDGAYTIVVWDDAYGSFASSICRALGLPPLR